MKILLLSLIIVVSGCSVFTSPSASECYETRLYVNKMQRGVLLTQMYRPKKPNLSHMYVWIHKISTEYYEDCPGQPALQPFNLNTTNPKG